MPSCHFSASWLPLLSLLARSPITTGELVVTVVLPPLRVVLLRALWGRRGGPGALALLVLVLVPVEGQELPLLLDILLCLQLLKGNLGWGYFH